MLCHCCFVLSFILKVSIYTLFSLFSLATSVRSSPTLRCNVPILVVLHGDSLNPSPFDISCLLIPQPSLTILSKTTLSKPVNNTPKKRAPKAAAVDENGQPLPKVPRKKAEPKLDAEGNPIPKAPRKKPEPKLDAEGNPINKAARKKPEPKLDAEGNPIPKPPRKPAVKKTKAEPKIEDDEDADMSMVVDMASASAAAGNGTQTDGVMHNGTFIAYARPEKPNGSSNGGSVAGGGDGGGLTVLEAKEAKEAAEKAAEVALKNAATVKDPATPAKAKKGPAKARINSPDGGVAVTPASKRKRGVKALANQDGEDAGTPTKKKKANALPTCRAELNDADKLLLDMKKAGKTWAEIVPQWAKLSGIEPQKSTLSVRYSRIMANLTEWKDGDVSFSFCSFPLVGCFLSSITMY